MTPEPFLATLAFLHATRSWLEFGFENHLWLVDRERCLSHENIDLMRAVVFFQEGCSHLAMGRSALSFRLFNLAFDRLRFSVEAESPDLVLKILRRVFLARKTIGFLGLALSRKLLRHMHGLYDKIYGAGHYLTEFWEKMVAALDSDTWIYHIERVAQVHEAILAKRLAPFEKFALETTQIHAEFDATIALTNRLQSLLDLARNEERRNGTPRRSGKSEKSINRIRLELALALVQSEPVRSEEARGHLANILANEFNTGYERARAMRRLSLLEEKLGHYSEAKEQMEEAIRLTDECKGKMNSASLKYLRLLADFQERVHGAAAAAAILMEIEQRVGILEQAFGSMITLD